MQILTARTQLLTLYKKILLTSVFLMCSASLQAEFVGDIGGVTEHTGSGGINRDGDLISTAVGLGVMQMDAVSTVNGRMLLTFLDDSVVRLTEHTDIVLTNYYYDPNDKAKSRRNREVCNRQAWTSTKREYSYSDAYSNNRCKRY